MAQAHRMAPVGRDLADRMERGAGRQEQEGCRMVQGAGRMGQEGCRMGQGVGRMGQAGRMVPRTFGA